LRRHSASIAAKTINEETRTTTARTGSVNDMMGGISVPHDLWCRMAATINACDGAGEAMDGGHTPHSRRDHRFGSLRDCACARREAVPERSHLSGLQ
jgi:hypothetical protein